jgi:hypothetical protein
MELLGILGIATPWRILLSAEEQEMILCGSNRTRLYLLFGFCGMRLFPMRVTACQRDSGSV